jgi:acyl-CoA synthetase (AMP-forming)/AMP-acid ligase II
MAKRRMATAAPGPRTAAETIPGVLSHAGRAFANDEAVMDGSVRLTYGELWERVEQATNALIATDVEAGDRVAIWAPNSVEWVIASFAVYAAGAVLVPLNTRFKGDEAGHVLRVSGARVLLAVTDLLGVDLLGLLETQGDLDVDERVIISGPPRPGCVAWSDFLRRGEDLPSSDLHQRAADLRADSTSDIIFTSGTTGRPKGAMLSHGASVRVYREWSDLVGLRRGDRYLVVYPFFHTAGLKSGILACALTGATVIPNAVFDTEPLMRRVSEERITVLPGPPTVFQSIWSHPGYGSFDLSSLRLSVTGAATVPVEVVRRMRQDLHIDTVVTGYGLTETTGTVTMCRHDDPPEIVATTVGRPLPGVDLRIVDTEGSDVAVGQAGEILVKGYNIMKGYFDDDEATAEAIDPEGWLRTGDIGYLGEDGNLRITDRKKDMFIVGGFNAYPAEIEGMMLQHPDVAQVAVIGVPDQRLGQVGMAFVVPTSGRRLDEDELVAWCRQHMANFKVPRRIRAVRELPLNPSGKVMKFKLRDEVGEPAGHS